MYKLIDFYEPLDALPEGSHERGQFWWTCYPNPSQSTEVVRIRRGRASERVDVRRFDPEREQIDTESGTAANEFWALAKFKRRPVVILSTGGTPFRHATWRGGERYLVGPIYTLREELTGEYKAPPAFVWGAMRYQYSAVFYLPRHDGFGLREAVVRLDMMTTLQRSWLVDCRRVCLTRKAIYCLDEWLSNYVYRKVRSEFNAELEVYRDLLGEDPQVRTGLFGQPES